MFPSRLRACRFMCRCALYLAGLKIGCRGQVRTLRLRYAEILIFASEKSVKMRCLFRFLYGPFLGGEQIDVEIAGPRIVIFVIEISLHAQSRRSCAMGTVIARNGACRRLN